MKTPTVSINLCCYNSEKYIEETLQSLFAQTWEDWELVVVNDGSTDSTEQIIKRHMEEGRQIVYHFQRNTGLGKARNKAIELSTGKFIALIDHDDRWEPEKLQKQLALFAGDRQIGVVYSDARALFPDGRTRIFSAHVRMYRGRVLTPLVLSDFVVCSSILIPRTVLDEVGWFNPQFTQVEEYDLLIRIAERYEFDYVSEPLVTYRLSLQNSSWDGCRMQTETIALLGEVLKRRPEVSDKLGVNVTRVKRAGLRCTLGEAQLLQGRFRAAYHWYGGMGGLVQALPRMMVLWVVSFFPRRMVVDIVGRWRRIRKRMMVGRS